MAELPERARPWKPNVVSTVVYDLVSLLHQRLDDLAVLPLYESNAREAGDEAVLSVLEDFYQREVADADRLRRLLCARLGDTTPDPATTGVNAPHASR